MSARLTFRLPSAIRRSPTGLMYFVYWAPFIAIYQITNRWPLVEPRELPFTWLDEVLPFVPALLPVYICYLPLYWWTVARSESDDRANRIFYAAHFQLLLSVWFFVLMPIRMPLELFYRAETPYNWADGLWRWFDAPNNCFPSLHVSNCLLLLRFNWTRPHRWFFASASVAVIASTVLVKQHYVVDVLGGLVVYLASAWFLARVKLRDERPSGACGDP